MAEQRKESSVDKEHGNNSGDPAKGGRAMEQPSAQTLPNSSMTYSYNMLETNCGLFFMDGKRRIDFILAWSNEKSKKQDAYKARAIFESNLMEEGLQLEYTVTINRISYVKIHAPYEVLKRYADILKLRLPIKSAIPTDSEKRRNSLLFLQQRLTKHFQYDKNKLPPIFRSYTCPYSSNKEYLFDVEDKPEHLFSNATRSRIVYYILRRKHFDDATENSFSCGINKMVADHIYTAAYPLHEGNYQGPDENPRKILFDCWASWRNCFKHQPIDHIRAYFGEKIALYFAWLGFYTSMLIPATLVGIVAFSVSLFNMTTDTTSKELCDSKFNITMCPLCDGRCGYWKLDSVCLYAQMSRIFDNMSTVFFAVFMSLWGTFFLEFWKREQAVIQYKWDLTSFVKEEQPPRPEYLSKLENWGDMRHDPVTGMMEPHLPFWRVRFPRYFISYSVMFLMTVFAMAVFVTVIAYRVSLFMTLNLLADTVTHASSVQLLKENSSLVTTFMTAFINLIVIVILDYIYGHLAFWLTNWEYLRTQSEYDNSITLKLIVFQFINFFAPIYYIAFFKGHFVGSPDKYTRVLGNRLEECHPAGCLIELCIQLAIIMVGRQLIQNNLQETVLPKIKKFIKIRLLRKTQELKLATKSWEKDYFLEPVNEMSLFYEYLEMVMQFGFLTIFCAAFPLGPVIALVNNIMEIRVDANKFVTHLQRPVALKSGSIGVWYSVLYAISRIAIITNALIIALTSEFIPRFVYVTMYSPDGSLAGYVNFTLSYFNTSDFTSDHKPRHLAHEFVQGCRYKDFRNPPWEKEPYTMTSVYWHILAVRLAFVCIFENVVVVVTSLLSWLIPDIPADLKEQIRRETYITNKIVLATELKRAHQGEKGADKMRMSGTEMEVSRHQSVADMDSSNDF